MTLETRPDLTVEFSRQRDLLLEQGYPRLAGLTPQRFRTALDAVWSAIESWHTLPAAPERAGHLPFALVVGTAPAEAMLQTVHLPGRTTPGILDRNHGEAGLTPYRPIPGAEPPADLYAIVGVDRGDEFRGEAPREAVATLLSRGRSPLTISEGLAVQVVAPALLQPNHGFSLAGSRREDPGNAKRVPALWISGRAPKLGWCWEGNPHSWLGTASTAARLA